MKPLLGLALALACATLPAARAQPPTQTPCIDFAKQLGITYATFTPKPPDGCRYTDVVRPLVALVALHSDQLTVRHIDFAKLSADQPPTRLLIEANGTIVRAGRTPVQQYISTNLARPFDIVLDYTFDSAQRQLQLDRFAIQGTAFGSLELSGTVVGVDPAALNQPQASQDAGLARLSLRFSNLRMFEAFVVPALAGMLLGDAPDPAAKVEALKAHTILLLTPQLAAIGADADTLAALGRFLKDLPHPTGTLAIDGVFVPPLTAADLASTPPTAPPAAGRKLTASYP